MNAVFDELVRLSGLSPIFARTVVGRAATRAGIAPESMQRSDIEKLLPELQRALNVYLGEAVAVDRTSAIRKSIAAT